MVSLQKRIWLLAVAIAVVTVACGGGTDDAATTTSAAAAASSTASEGTDAPAEGDAPATTAAETSGSGADSDGTDEPSGPDGEPAPDFTLALADGGTFSPSAEAKPIYMVFWAEW